MKRLLMSLSLGAALMATAAMAPLEGTVQDPVPEIDRKDMACLALYAWMLGENPDEQSMAVAGMVYHIGRLEGRNPGTDQVGRFSTWANAQTEEALMEMIETAGPRCAAEITTLGESMIRHGNAM